MNNNNVIIYQEHINKQKMKHNNSTIKSQDKQTTNDKLQYLTKKLTAINKIICDGCASSAKSAKNIVQTTEQHKNATIQKDV